jgi:hypothetical protein
MVMIDQNELLELLQIK